MANTLKRAAIYLGLSEPKLEETAPENSFEAQQDTQVVETAAPLAANVTPLHRVTPTKAAAAQPMSEILTVHPRSYSEAPQIAANFRDGVPVILNLAQVNDIDARRIIDFVGGLVLGLNGRVERVTGKVFLLTPEHIMVSEMGEEKTVNHNDSGSFFVAPQEQ